MPFEPDYHESKLTRAELDKTMGPVLVEFGASWCGICSGFAPQLKSLMDAYPTVTHIKVEDGRGKPLGRSFRVKLWPTFVFLRDGQLVRQVSRPEADGVPEGAEGV